MPFPASPRIIYEKNPLVEVICQLKFPPILRIDADLPSAFQELVRESYPLFEGRQELQLALPPALAQFVGIESGLGGGKNHQFTSGDGNWVVNLTRDFLALTCRRYERWEQFKDHLGRPVHGLLDLYSPAFFSRIGLRYRDVIKRSQLGLDGVPWSDLLTPQIAGELSSGDIAGDIEHAASEVVIRFAEGLGKAHLRHGLVRAGSEGETCYLIDTDFFTEERTEVANYDAILDRFKQQAARLFRWCITDRLHRAMGPQPI